MDYVFVKDSEGYVFKKLKSEVDSADKKLSFIRRLLDAWDKQLSVIRQLCKNTEIEITQLKATEALGNN